MQPEIGDHLISYWICGPQGGNSSDWKVFTGVG